MQTPLPPLTRLALALAAGLLEVFTFPKLGWSWLAWIALVPLLLAVVGVRSRRAAFLTGYLTGIVFFAGTCYWIYGVMRSYGGLGVLAASGVFLVFLIVLAAYFGLFALAIGHLSRRSIGVALAVAPFAWVAIEFLRTYLFSGFPWNLHGYALVERAGLARLAAGSGVYGCSLLLVAVNALIALAVLCPNWTRLLAVAVVALVLAVLGWREPPRSEGAARAILVQTNIPVQTEYPADWLERNRRVLDQLDTMTAAAASAGSPPALIIWPETPAPFYFRQDPRFRARMLVLAEATRGNLIVGIVDYRRDPTGREAPYNSAVVLSPGGGVVAQYDKIHLVPFGEYVPMRRLLWFARKLTAEVGDFASGDAPTVARTDSGAVGIFICYEAIFPGLVSNFTALGAEVLVNISNDGWFGRSAAPEQHLWMARMRAIENDRWLLRATNNGITCVIDPQGRVRARLGTDVRGTVDARFAFRRGETLYVHYGNWVAWLSVGVAIAALFRQYWIEQMEVAQA